MPRHACDVDSPLMGVLLSPPPASSSINRHAVSMNRKGETVLSNSSLSRKRCSLSTLKVDPPDDIEDGGGEGARSNFIAPGNLDAL